MTWDECFLIVILVAGLLGLAVLGGIERYNRATRDDDRPGEGP